MNPLCDHIRGDAYECMQAASWLVRTQNGDYYACNNHVWQFLDHKQATVVYPASV
jgi:hypothetical protein